MSTYSELARAARETEMAEQIERLHGDVTARESRISELDGELHFANLAVRGHDAGRREAEEETERLSAAISRAIEDLRVLSEVPLGELDSSIKAIADRLADQNGERY